MTKIAKSKKQYTIGLDIGGTKMLGVLFDGEKVIADYTLATPKDNMEHFYVMVNALVEPLLDKVKELKVKVEGVGVSIAGAVDYNSGKIVNAPNIPIINNQKIAFGIEKKIGFKTVIDNDVNCFIRAEAEKGAAKKFNNTYGIIIGTGIGGAWWLNGKVYKAPYSGEGEPGEMIIDVNDNMKLEEAYHRLTQNNPSSLADEAYHGDVLAERTFEELGSVLGKALSNINNLIAPEAFILGGGLIQSSDLFLSILKKTLRENTVSSELRRKQKVLKSKLGKFAGAIGAAMLIDQLVEN